jgi:hypothetical protein
MKWSPHVWAHLLLSVDQAKIISRQQGLETTRELALLLAAFIMMLVSRPRMTGNTRKTDWFLPIMAMIS